MLLESSGALISRSDVGVKERFCFAKATATHLSEARRQDAARPGSVLMASDEAVEVSSVVEGAN